MQPFKTPLARLFKGSEELEVTPFAAPVTAVPLTMACWFQPTSTTAANTQALMLLGDTGVTNRFLMAADGSGVDTLSVQTGAVSANTTTPFIAGRWHHACGVWAAVNSRTAYLDAGGKATNTGSSTPAGVSRCVIGARYNTTLGLRFTGQIVWPAIWNIALSEEDVARLAMGASPLTIKPESLVAFWDWTGAQTEFGLRGTYPLVNNATLPVDGPGFLAQVVGKRRRFNSVAAGGGNRRRRVITGASA